MRRLALVLVAAAVLVAGCGGSSKAHVWVTRPHSRALTVCVSTDCGPYSATVNWAGIALSGNLGYKLFCNTSPTTTNCNGGQVATVTTSPYTFVGLDCGQTFTLTVTPFNSGGNGSPNPSSYSTPACSGVNAPTQQALISQGQPAFSTGTTANAASNMVDSSYDYFQCTTPCSGIIDLSSISSAQKTEAAVTWWNGTIDFDTTDDGPDGGPVNKPTSFTIDCNTAAGGGSPPTTGWTTLQTVTGNKFNAGQYALNLSTCNWLRMNVTAATTGTDAAWHLDVSACSSTCAAPTDAWLFLGDSITSISLTVQPTTPPNFNQTVNAGATSFYPSGIDGGNSGWTTGNFLATDAAVGKAFVNEYMDDFPAAHYVTLNLGTNDVDTSVTVATFLSNMQALVADVIAKGRVPVVPTIPWAPSACGFSKLGTGDDPANSGTYNFDIENNVWTMPGVVAGPDLWTFFDQNQSLIGLGNCPHPSSPAGTNALRTQWADWALAHIY